MSQTQWKKEQVVILCGGEGTRMREETEFKPKALGVGSTGEDTSQDEPEN